MGRGLSQLQKDILDALPPIEPYLAYYDAKSEQRKAFKPLAERIGYPEACEALPEPELPREAFPLFVVELIETKLCIPYTEPNRVAVSRSLKRLADRKLVHGTWASGRAYRSKSNRFHHNGTVYGRITEGHDALMEGVRARSQRAEEWLKAQGFG